jgi:hypothetical protein
MSLLSRQYVSKGGSFVIMELRERLHVSDIPPGVARSLSEKIEIFVRCQWYKAYVVPVLPQVVSSEIVLRLLWRPWILSTQ